MRAVFRNPRPSKCRAGMRRIRVCKRRRPTRNAPQARPASGGLFSPDRETKYRRKTAYECNLRAGVRGETNGSSLATSVRYSIIIGRAFNIYRGEPRSFAGSILGHGALSPSRRGIPGIVRDITNFADVSIV